MVKSKIKQLIFFMNDIFVYTPQIPTGDARTKGYGKTCMVFVLRANKKTFRTRNSKHIELKYFGQVRMDYGLIRGHSRKVLDAAEEFANLQRKSIVKN